MPVNPSSSQGKPQRLALCTPTTAYRTGLREETHRRPKGAALTEKLARLIQPGVQASEGLYQIGGGMEKRLACFPVIEKQIPSGLQVM
jgi:hypothetical protein